MWITEKYKQVKARFDSLYDPLTARGSSIDKTRRTRGNIAFNSNEYNKGLYIANGFVQNIIDQPAEDATREWIDIETNLDKENEIGADDKENIGRMILNRMDELGVREKIKNLIRYKRMYSNGGYLYYAVKANLPQEGAELAKPLPGNELTKIEFIHVVTNPDSIQIQNENNNDWLKENYNKIKFTKQGQEIHPSRLSWLVNSFFPEEISGLSIIQIIEDAVKGQDDALWSVRSIIMAMMVKVFKSDEIVNLSIDKKAELIAKIKHLLDTQGVFALKNDEDFKQLIMNVTGIKELFDFIFDNLSGVSRIPKNILLGKAHGVVTAGEYDSLNYYAQIEKIQKNEIESILDKIIGLIIREKDGPVNKTIGDIDAFDWEVKFKPLWVLDPLSQADKELKDAQRDQINITVGKVAPGEAREMDERLENLEPFVAAGRNLNFMPPDLKSEEKKPEEKAKDKPA